MSTASDVSNALENAAPIAQALATDASVLSGQPEIAAMTGVALALASSIAQIIVQAQSSKATPASHADWTAMGVALGAALKAYNAK